MRVNIRSSRFAAVHSRRWRYDVGMSVDGSATIFCSTPLRVPVVELLRDKDAVGSTSDGARPCQRPMGPVRSALCWRKSSRPLVKLLIGGSCTTALPNAKPNSNCPSPNSKPNYVCGNSNSSAARRKRGTVHPATTHRVANHSAGSPTRPRGQQRGQQGHGRRDYSHLPADIEDAELTGDDGCCPQCKRPL